jgi:hypothetical protein
MEGSSYDKATVEFLRALHIDEERIYKLTVDGALQFRRENGYRNFAIYWNKFRNLK